LDTQRNDEHGKPWHVQCAIESGIGSPLPKFLLSQN
jgi:hypothetical protein